MANFELFWYSRTFLKIFLKVENRAKNLPSILNTNKSVEINFIAQSDKLTPSEVKNFLARFSTFRIFFKFLECQFDLDKKPWGQKKSVIPYFQDPLFNKNIDVLRLQI